MVVAIIVAVLVGLVSVIPFNVAIKKIRAVDPTKSLNLLGPFLLTIAGVVCHPRRGYGRVQARCA